TALADGTARAVPASNPPPGEATRIAAGVLGTHPLRTPEGRREFRFDNRGVVTLWDWAPCPITEGAAPDGIPPSDAIEDRPVEDLLLLAELLSGRRLLQSDTMQSMNRVPLKEAWQALRALYPADFQPDPAEVRRWHGDAAQ